MSFDLTALGITEAIPTSNWDDFQGDTPVLPVESSRGPALLKGLYVLKVPAFSVPTGPDSKDPFIPVPNKQTGRMQFKMNPTISRPEAFDGRTVYGFYVPLVKSEKQRMSRGMELIIACGSDARPNTDQEWIQAAFDLSNREFGAHLDLRVRDGQTGKEYFSRQDLFYKRADGVRSSTRKAMMRRPRWRSNKHWISRRAAAFTRTPISCVWCLWRKRSRRSKPARRTSKALRLDVGAFSRCNDPLSPAS
jgi:hypothetical protein